MNQRKLAILALTLGACSSSTSETRWTNLSSEESLGGLAMAVTLPDPARDVTDFVVTLHPAGAECGEEPLEVVNLVADINGLPAGVLGVGQSADRRFANGVIALDEGSYLACAQPLKSDLLPSEECELTQETFDVVAGQTVGVVLIAQCEGATVGAASVVSTVNTAPSVASVEAIPSLFPATCESTILQAEFQDPDGDDTFGLWEVVEEPEQANYVFSSDGTSSSLLTATPGDYLVRVTVSDSAGGQSALEVPLQVSLGATGCAGATVITPVSASFGGGPFNSVDRLIDGSGLSGEGDILSQTHSAGAGGENDDSNNFKSSTPDVLANAIEFDLGGLHDLSEVYIWNYSHVLGFFFDRDATLIDISTSTNGVDYSFNTSAVLSANSDNPEFPQSFPLIGEASHVRFNVVSGAGGIELGLGEVRFVAGGSALP